MLRVSVVGNSGSGKSMCAKKIAEILGVPYIKLDAIHHLEQWEPIAPEKFHSLLVDITAQAGNRTLGIIGFPCRECGWRVRL